LHTQRQLAGSRKRRAHAVHPFPHIKTIPSSPSPSSSSPSSPSRSEERERD
ncbi:unnamed protein product, partial [Closterium sp. NIES-54]